MAKKGPVLATYPEALAKARTAPPGAELPSQKDREGFYAHVGQEVGTAPAPAPAEGES
jgi:hypothetical protein